MIKRKWDESKLPLYPLSIFVEYLNVMHNNYVKDDFKKVNVTTNEFIYLFNILHQKTMSQKELADFFFVSEANVAKIVKNLENKGLIKRVIDENNKNRKLIYITEDGRDKTIFLDKVTKDWERKVTSSISDDDFQRFKEIFFDLEKKSTEL